MAAMQQLIAPVETSKLAVATHFTSSALGHD